MPTIQACQMRKTDPRLRRMSTVGLLCASCVGLRQEGEATGGHPVAANVPYAWAVAWDDVDRDGRAEVAIGSSDGVRLYSGRSGAMLAKCPGSQAARFRDVDGDGVCEFIVLIDGRPTVVSGSNMGVRSDWGNFQPTSSACSAVAVVRDVDADGVRDVIVGSKTESVEERTGAGCVWLLSGASGEVLDKLTGSSSGEQLGRQVLVPNDDSSHESSVIVVGCGVVKLHRIDHSSRATLGAAVKTVRVPSANTEILSCGDMDGDRYPEFTIVSTRADARSVETIGLEVVSTHPGLGSLARVEMPADADLCGVPWTSHPSLVASSGDMDGDGRTEIVLALRADVTSGERQESCYRGHVTVLSLAPLLRVRDWATDEVFVFARDEDGLYVGSRCYDTPWSVGLPGDVDLDGVEDVLVVPERVERGQAFILSGATKRRITQLQIGQ